VSGKKDSVIVKRGREEEEKGKRKKQTGSKEHGRNQEGVIGVICKEKVIAQFHYKFQRVDFHEIF
jgi:hypothetical protein